MDIRRLLLSATLAILAMPALAADTLSGFYSSSADACLQATGTLYLCGDGQCRGQDYRFGQRSAPPARITYAEAATANHDGNGFALAAGDYSLTVTRDTGSTLQIVRRTADTLLTTYLARLDGTKAGFAFIANGKHLDPASPPVELQLCRAYDGYIAELLADGDPPARLEAQSPPPPPPVVIDYGNVGPAVIPVEFAPPLAAARIVDVIPVTLGDPDYPALFVLWVMNVGGTPIPLQVLTYDHERKAYLDGTAQVIDGPVPLLDYPGNLATAPFGKDGAIGIFISSIGLDAPPFPRTTNTLLLPTGDGRLKDRSQLLPQAPQFTHDVSSGVIDGRGRWGLYVNDMYVPEYYVSRRDGKLRNAADNLPGSIHKDGPKFTSSAMADVDGDGLADIVLGSADQRKWRSRILLNDGTGRFNQRKAIELPLSPLPDHVGAITGSVSGAGIMDIQPIHLTSPDHADLIVTSAGGGSYAGHAIQLLVNDGKGHFTDRTADLIDAPAETYLNLSEEQHTWVQNVTVVTRDGRSDFVTQSASDSVPSYVFTNDGHGRFTVGAYTRHRPIAGAAIIGGQPVLIVTDRDTINLVAYPEGAAP